jgi:hypothetical protein
MTLEWVSLVLLGFTGWRRSERFSSAFSMVGLGLFVYALKASDGGVFNLILSTLAVAAFWYAQSMRVTLSSARTLILVLLGLGFAVFLFQDTLPFLGNQGMTGIWKAFDIKPGQIASLKSSHETAMSLYFDHEPTGDERYFKTGVLNDTTDGLEYHIGPRQPLPEGMFPRTREFSKILPDRNLDQDLDILQHWWTRDFGYTLDPGLMDGENPLDTFLFQKKIGFCEHYAAALTTFLKLKGYDAHVTLGLSGGTWNPIFRKLTYDMADAHAWVEVYSSETHHWRRLDPTLWINPTENAPRSSRALLNWTFGILALSLIFIWMFSGRIKDPVRALLVELGRYEKRAKFGETRNLTVSERIIALQKKFPLQAQKLQEILTLYRLAYYENAEATGYQIQLLRKVRRLRISRWLNSAGRF